MQQDVLRTLNDQQIGIEDFRLAASALADLLKAIESGQIDTTRGREVFQKLLADPRQSVAQAIDSLGIVAVAADEIDALCRELLAANPDVVQKVKSGNAKAIGSLVGQAKKKNPNADPRAIQDRCLAIIASESSA